MKKALQIWDEFTTGKLTTKQAFDDINKALQGASTNDQAKLLRLSEKILDKDVPLQERNTELEKAFWNYTHKESEE